MKNISAGPITMCNNINICMCVCIVFKVYLCVSEGTEACPYLDADRKPQSLLVNHSYSHDSLDHRGNEGVDSEHQGIAFHTEINSNLKSKSVQMERVLKGHICGLLFCLKKFFFIHLGERESRESTQVTVGRGRARRRSRLLTD